MVRRRGLQSHAIANSKIEYGHAPWIVPRLGNGRGAADEIGSGHAVNALCRYDTQPVRHQHAAMPDDDGADMPQAIEDGKVPDFNAETTRGAQHF